MNDGGTRAQVYKIDGRWDITTLSSPVPCQYPIHPEESGEQLWNLVPRQAHGRKGNTLKVPMPFPSPWHAPFPMQAASECGRACDPGRIRPNKARLQRGRPPARVSMGAWAARACNCHLPLPRCPRVGSRRGKLYLTMSLDVEKEGLVPTRGYPWKLIRAVLLKTVERTGMAAISHLCGLMVLRRSGLQRSDCRGIQSLTPLSRIDRYY
jgi:hypothetical protein